MKEYYDLRNKDLLKVVKRILAKYPIDNRPPLNDIVRMAINSPAPHYYITFPYALRQIRKLRKEKGAYLSSISETHSDSQNESIHALQIKELEAKVTKLQNRFGSCISDDEALTKILCSSAASKFFISENYARKLIRFLLYSNLK